MLLALVPAMLVIAQPDLGTGARLRRDRADDPVRRRRLRGGTSPRWRRVGAVAIALVLVVAPAAGVHVLKPYQVDRLTAFLNPSDNPADAGLPAEPVADRDRLGREDRARRRARDADQAGLPARAPHRLHLRRGRRATTASSGAALVLSLYALLIWRGLRILTMAKNLFGALIAGGIVAMLMFQVFVNVGMTVGIMPITGVPLPLLSATAARRCSSPSWPSACLQSIYVQAQRRRHRARRRALIT